MPLTDLACRKAKPAEKLRKLSDMGGLQLWIYPNGSTLWRFAYRFDRKQKLLALGRYPKVSLQAARRARETAKDLLAQGADPSHERRVERLRQQFVGNTFAAIAKEYFSKLEREERAEATLSKTQWLLDFALPVLGSKSISDIKPIEVLAVLRTVETRGRYDTARRLRSTIGAVFRYAIATARTEVDPTVSLQGALVAPKAKSRSAIIDPKGVGALLRAIDSFDGQQTTKAALQLMALLFPRPGELRLAGWKEFDIERSIWLIPGERTKMRRPHRVPLCRQALAVLANLRRITGAGTLVFPSVRSARQPISDGTMNAALSRLGYSSQQATPHGFRATASTLLNESGLWNADAIERQLAHAEADDVRRAYARGQHWEERVRMMAWWGDYTDILKQDGSLKDQKTA